MRDIWMMLLGAFICHCFSVWRDRRSRPRRTLTCLQQYCPVGSTSVFLFCIKHDGNEIIKDVKMRFECVESDRIQDYVFSVGEQLQCDRLDPASTCAVRDTDHVFRSSWKFINPGDTVVLRVDLSPCLAPNNVKLDIDAEGIQVTRQRMQMKCGQAFLLTSV